MAFRTTRATNDFNSSTIESTSKSNEWRVRTDVDGFDGVEVVRGAEYQVTEELVERRCWNIYHLGVERRHYACKATTVHPAMQQVSD